MNRMRTERRQHVGDGSPLNPTLEKPPQEMRRLAIYRGYPVPWFVQWINDEPEFRIADGAKRRDALANNKCWVCGHRVGKLLTFVIGPMCGINRITSEPGCHEACAIYSARNCPFLSKPQMVRRQGGLEGLPTGCDGEMIERNPGVSLLWTTDKFVLVSDRKGGTLINVGEPVKMQYYAKGRLATRAEIDESIRTGLPILTDLALRDGPDALTALNKMVRRFQEYLLKE